MSEISENPLRPDDMVRSFWLSHCTLGRCSFGTTLLTTTLVLESHVSEHSVKFVSAANAKFTFRCFLFSKSSPVMSCDTEQRDPCKSTPLVNVAHF